LANIKSAVPTARESPIDTHENFLLEFQDIWEEQRKSSNPRGESEYVLSLLSLFSEMKVEFDSMQIENIQSTFRRSHSSLIGKIELPSDLEDLFRKLLSMDVDLLRQYMRGCSAYRTALSMIDDNPTLSFFLLVTAIEAISGKVIKRTDRENFTKFILTYLPISFENELETKELLPLLVSRAYDMRCEFTHGGCEISRGSVLADQLKLNYVKHQIRNKELYSPSVRWFARVVRAALINFLRQQLIMEEKKSDLSGLAMEEGVIYLQAAKDVKEGQVVTTKDVDLSFENK